MDIGKKLYQILNKEKSAKTLLLQSCLAWKGGSFIILCTSLQSQWIFENLLIVKNVHKFHTESLLHSLTLKIFETPYKSETFVLTLFEIMTH